MVSVAQSPRVTHVQGVNTQHFPPSPVEKKPRHITRVGFEATTYRFKQVLWYLSCLPRSSLPFNDQYLMILDGLKKILPKFEDGKKLASFCDTLFLPLSG